MKKLAIVMLALIAVPAAGGAQTKPEAEATGDAAGLEAAMAARPRGVEDPHAFVEAVYQSYLRDEAAGPEEPIFVFSDRLRGLYLAYDAWARQHDDLVGSLDFDWWINAQDWQLSNLSVTETVQDENRRTEVARFTNVDRPEEIHLLFVRQGERWYLDDVVEGSGHGDDGWTLSALLQERED